MNVKNVLKVKKIDLNPFCDTFCYFDGTSIFHAKLCEWISITVVDFKMSHLVMIPVTSRCSTNVYKKWIVTSPSMRNYQISDSIRQMKQNHTRKHDFTRTEFVFKSLETNVNSLKFWKGNGGYVKLISNQWEIIFLNISLIFKRSTRLQPNGLKSQVVSFEFHFESRKRKKVENISKKIENKREAGNRFFLKVIFKNLKEHVIYQHFISKYEETLFEI